MGHRLVAAAFAFVNTHNQRALADNAEPLDGLAVALLVWMSHCARDSDDEPVYFAGREASCAALGLPTTETGQRRLMRATRTLKDAGALAVAQKGYRGSTARYRLIHEGGALVSPIPPESMTPVSPIEGERVTPQAEWVTPQSRMGDTRDTPIGITRKTYARPRGGARARRHDCDRDGHAFDPVSGWCVHGCGIRAPAEAIA